MIRVLVTSHGLMAEGLVDTAKMIIGSIENLDVVTFTAQMGVDELEEIFEEKTKDVNDTHQLLILCDMLGGSPFNVASKFSYENENISVFYGMNLPLLIESLMRRNVGNLAELTNGLKEIMNETVGWSEI